MKNKDVLLLIQLTLCISLIATLIASLIESSLFNLMEIIASLTFFIMAINNYIIYKRKYLTPLYILFGLLLLISAIVGLIYG